MSRAAGKRRPPPASFLVFDIETEVDKELLQAALFAQESADGAFEAMRRQLAPRTFFPVTVHAPVSIVMAHAGADRVLREVVELRADRDGEEGVVRAFWRRLEDLDGQLVSFNGRTFDIPVMELRALKYGLAVPRHFGDEGFRGRVRRHLDLYDELSSRGAAPLRGGLDLLARLVGLPGKGDVSGAMVQELWERGEHERVHRYCRRDVLQTYFLFLRYERMRGAISQSELTQIEDRCADYRSELAL